MPDIPKEVSIQEEGPREGIQISAHPIATADKIRLVDALSETGLKEIQCASFVNPKRVPNWADAEIVARSVRKLPGIKYTVLWLNEKGFERARQIPGLYLKGALMTSPSEQFLTKNQNQTFETNAQALRNQLATYKEHGLHFFRGSVAAAFGCNYDGDIAVADVIAAIERVLQIAEEGGVTLDLLNLADTMGWATPRSIKQVVHAVRERWPDMRLNLHLHNTRGMGIANAYAGLEMGVDSFDGSIGGVGGCPFAAHKGAAGNVCTEDLVFMCEEMGIKTGVDLDKLIEVARLGDEIFGYELRGSVMRGGSLSEIRKRSTAVPA